MIAIVLVLLGAMLVWLWRGNRDPLLYLTPFALVFPPLIAYGSRALGWPLGWLSTRVALTGCLLLFVIMRLLRSDYRWRSVPGLRWIAPYLVLVALSVLWGVFSVDPTLVVNDFITWLIPIVIFLCLAMTPRSETEIGSAIRVIGVLALVEALFCLFQGLSLVGADRFVPGPIAALTHFGQRDLWFGALRLYGTLPNLGPNALGTLLIFPATLAVVCAATRNGMPRLLWGAVALGTIAVIVSTYSRGAQLGLSISLLTLPAWLRSKRGMLLSVGALVMSASLLANTPIGRNTLQLYAAGRFDPDAQARLDVWRAILSGAPTHLIGRGFDGWYEGSRHEITIGDPLKAFGAPHPADNMWMRELADRGLPGVIALALLMTGIIVLTFRACARDVAEDDRRRLLAAVGAATLGWSIAFVGGDYLMYLETAGLFCFCLGLALPAAAPLSS